MALQELEFDHALFAGNRPGAAAPGDEKLLVRFYMHYIEDPAETEKQGRPIYKDCEFIRIMTPGDRNNVIDRPIRPEDKSRFARQYAHYKETGGQAVIGTVLEEWPLATRAMTENLKSLGFHTVEQLAEARDDIVLNNPGMMQLRDRAKHYLEVSKGNAPLTQLEAKLADANNEREVLARQVAELSARVEELTPKKK